MRIALIFSTLALALIACGDTHVSTRSTGGTPAVSNSSSGLLPGEVSGCDGDVCANKADVNE